MGVQHRKKSSRRGRGRHATRDHSPEAQLPCRPLEVNEETRWKARVFLQADPGQTAASDVHETDEARDARLILVLLNKLTPTKFEKHVTRFLAKEAVHESENRLRDAVATIVERAADDARYAAMYAALCSRLAKDLPPTPAPEGATETVRPARSFTEVLLGVCRDELQRDVVAELCGISPQDRVEDVEEQEYTEALARRRYVGHLRFVGELYNCGLTGMDTFLDFVHSMLRMAGLPGGTVEELKLEGLCMLLMTCGVKLEAAPTTAHLQRCWSTLESLIHEEDEQTRRLSTRMNFMVLDLLELRAAGWQVKGPLRQRKQLVAKTLSQIKEEAERENGEMTKPGREKRVHFRQASAGKSN